MKFKMKEATVEVRGESIRVRELTHAERLQWVRAIQEDKFRGPGLLVSLGSLEPTFTEETAGDLPPDVVEVLVDKIMDLTKLKKAKKEGDDSKQPDAGGAVPVQAGSGAGEVSKPN